MRVFTKPKKSQTSLKILQTKQSFFTLLKQKTRDNKVLFPQNGSPKYLT